MKWIKFITMFVCNVAVFSGCENVHQNVKPTTLPAPVAKVYPDKYVTYSCGPDGQRRVEGYQEIPDSWVVQVWAGGAEQIIRGKAGNCAGPVTFRPGSVVGAKVESPSPQIYAVE